MNDPTQLLDAVRRRMNGTPPPWASRAGGPPSATIPPPDLPTLAAVLQAAIDQVTFASVARAQTSDALNAAMLALTAAMVQDGIAAGLFAQALGAQNQAAANLLGALNQTFQQAPPTAPSQ